jgi:hypothetical protein
MSEYQDDSLVKIAEDLAGARDAWWQTWEDANLDKDNRSTLGYDIEQGWDAAWECIEQAIAAHDEQVRTSEREAKAEAFEEGAQAFAWAAAHGDSPAHYVVENNPYRVPAEQKESN